jgi:hypothetical protein
MEPWIWGVIVGVPVIATGIAYSMGAFSTDTSDINRKIREIEMERTAFTGDDDSPYGGRRRKTKKSKSKHKKTKRRS